MRIRGATFVLSLIFFVSCTKSGALTGSGTTNSSSFGTISGSANGGLSPLSGASVNLYLGGSSTPVASATTAADGSFSIVFNGQTSGNFLYLTITGGNAGSGTNSNNQLMSIVGTSGAPLSSLKVNEMSTAATELVAMNMGLLNDTNGTITLNAPKNAAGASNVVTQFQNLIATGNLNTSNSNLTTSAQNGLKVMANAFAACIENSSNCSKLFSSATTSSGMNALTVLESGYYALLNSSNVASSLYTLAFPLNSTTGFNLTSASMPGGFTFNNPLAALQNNYPIGGSPQTIAIDGSGNLWVTVKTISELIEYSPTGSLLNNISTVDNFPLGLSIDAGGKIWVSNYNSGSVSEYNSSGTLINTFSAIGTNPHLSEIDSSGNIWVVVQGTGGVTELNSSGTKIATYATGNTTNGVSIDASGNVWISNYGSNSVTRLSSAGVTQGTFTGISHPSYSTIDQSGNVWISNQNSPGTITKLNSLGTVLGTFSVQNNPLQPVVDASGNVWVSNALSGTLMELNPSGLVLATYNVGGTPIGTAVDSSGNVYSAQGSLTQISAVANGPQFFPYSGPIWP